MERDGRLPTLGIPPVAEWNYSWLVSIQFLRVKEKTLTATGGWHHSWRFRHHWIREGTVPSREASGLGVVLGYRPMLASVRRLDIITSLGHIRGDGNHRP